MESSELKSCPFCKSSAVMIRHDWDCNYLPYYAVCGICGAQGPRTLNELYASSLWNNRPGGKNEKD
jgi:hypothetical protein